MRAPSSIRVAVILVVGAAGCRGHSSHRHARTPPAFTDESGPGVPEPALPTSCGHCDGYGLPSQVGTVANDTLDELSGMVASRRFPGVLYAHNDHGHQAAIYALKASGKLIAVFPLRASGARDPEDIGIGPCRAGSCLYLADTGDNDHNKKDYAIIRIPEPDVYRTRGSLAVDRLRFRYTDGSHNAEAVLVDPSGGGVYLVTKVHPGVPSAVYRIDLPASSEGMGLGVKLLDLPIPAVKADSHVTGGSAHPCGEGFLLRTYTTLFEFRTPPGTPFEAAFHVQPERVPVAREHQGESVTYRPDGLGYYTASEGGGAITLVTCQ